MKGIDYIYFSPTGNTKKTGNILCTAISEKICEHSLNEEKTIKLENDVVVVAMPVFGGRIPEFCADVLKKLKGSGKKAITIAVYGNRAYEDALLEMNDCLKEAGFEITASAACIAQHSIANEVAKERPDSKDEMEIRNFALQILNKLSCDESKELEVPGNVPYKARTANSNCTVSLDSCILCGQCEAVCPVNAIKITDNVETHPETCIMCLSCVKACSMGARILPESLKAGMEARLSPLKDIYHSNEFYL